MVRYTPFYFRSLGNKGNTVPLSSEAVRLKGHDYCFASCVNGNRSVLCRSLPVRQDEILYYNAKASMLSGYKEV